MPYQTILIHCNDKRRINRLLRACETLAGGLQAHLIGLSVVPPSFVIPAGMPGAPDTIVVDEHCKAYRRDVPEMKAAFENAAHGQGLVAQWRELEAGALGVANRLMPSARTSDLVIASQTDPQWPGTLGLDMADRLAMESGRPVLIIPNTGEQRHIADTVLVAWNGRREAARAAFDALPILQRAKEVRVIWINPQSEADTAGETQAGDICAALARHGVNCRAAEEVRPRAGIGEALLACAEDVGADLLVMGCYGHTRLREFVLGGASRHVLAHMTIPVLMSH
jgi:nucleotide-binding universal stress UspA family protein